MGSTLCEYLRYNIISFKSDCFQPDTHIVSHTHTHNLLRQCDFTTVVSIMFMLALLKNQNKNLNETGRWTGIEKPMTDASYLKTFQFLSSFKKWKRFIVSLWRAFLWLPNHSEQLICFFKSTASHCACNRVVKFTRGSYVENCKRILSLSVHSVCHLTLTHPTWLSHTPGIHSTSLCRRCLAGRRSPWKCWRNDQFFWSKWQQTR